MRKISKKQLYLTFVPAVLVLSAIALMSLIKSVEIPVLTRDVAATAEISPLTGLLSNLGVLLWCAATSICFFSALALRRLVAKDFFRFLLASAFLSLYLLLDDFFQFHEYLAYRYLKIPERYVLLGLGIAVAIYLIAFWRVILRTNYLMFILALGFLACSVVQDTMLESWVVKLGNWNYFIEDGFKWLGIVCWCSYFCHTSYQPLTSNLRG